MSDTNSVVIEGVKLVRQKHHGWLTEDGAHTVVERRRGQWEARDTTGRSVAKAGTRSGVVQRLKSVLQATK